MSCSATADGPEPHSRRTSLPGCGAPRTSTTVHTTGRKPVPAGNRESEERQEQVHNSGWYRWPKRAAVAAAALMMVVGQGCREAPRAAPPVPDLAGRWTVEFRLSGGDSSVSGTADLRPGSSRRTACRDRPGTCAGQVTGAHDVPFADMLGHDLSSEVIADVDEDGYVILLFGGCCDRGE